MQMGIQIYRPWDGLVVVDAGDEIDFGHEFCQRMVRGAKGIQQPNAAKNPHSSHSVRIRSLRRVLTGRHPVWNLRGGWARTEEE
jgi:hypothetical protein